MHFVYSSQDSCICPDILHCAHDWHPDELGRPTNRRPHPAQAPHMPVDGTDRTGARLEEATLARVGARRHTLRLKGTRARDRDGAAIFAGAVQIGGGAEGLRETDGASAGAHYGASSPRPPRSSSSRIGSNW